MSTLEAYTGTAYIATGGTGPYYSVLGYGSIGLAITGTFSAGTIKFQGSNDGNTWTDLQVLQASSPVLNNTITSVGNYVCGVVSYQTARLLVTGFTGSVVATSSISPQIVLPVVDGGNVVVDSLTITGLEGALAADSTGLVYAAQGVPGDVMRQSGTGGVSFYSTASSGSVYVAVGAAGRIISSTNKTHWTVRTSGVATDLYFVKYNGTFFTAVGASGVILTSTTGTIWTARTSGVATTLNGVTWDGSQWIAVGASQVVLTSPDAVTWTSRTFGTTTTINGIASNGGTVLVALCSGGVIKTSPTGVTWTTRTSGVATALWRGIWDGSQFVVAGSSGQILTSTDGVTWTPHTTGTAANLYDVAWSGALYVAVGAAGIILSASTLGAWTPQTSGVVQDLQAIIYASGWLSVGNTGVILNSSNATTWVAVSQNVWYASTPSGTGQLLAADSATASTLTVSTLLTTTVITASGLVTGAAGFTATGGSSAVGTMFKSSTSGLAVRGVTGSSNDLVLVNASNATLLANPTGTKTVLLAPSATGGAAGGFVGIGLTTATPINTGNMNILEMETDGSTQATMVSHNSGFTQIVGVGTAGTKASPTATPDDLALMGISGRGYDGAAYTTGSAASVSLRADGLWSGAANGAYIAFRGTPNASVTAAEWMRLYRGNLIIGATADNGARLQVTGTATVSGAITVSSLTTGAPTTGTAAPWKLGVIVSAAAAFDATSYAQIEINGVFRKVALCS